MARKTTTTTTTKRATPKPRPKPTPTAPVVKEDQDERRRRLAELWQQVQAGETTLTGGVVVGIPALPDGDVWVDVAMVSVILDVVPNRITYWLNRGEPKANPFPAGHRYLRVLLWPLSEILAWRDAEHSDTA